jgi:hypothetical protein
MPFHAAATRQYSWTRRRPYLQACRGVWWEMEAVEKLTLDTDRNATKTMSSSSSSSSVVVLYQSSSNCSYLILTILELSTISWTTGIAWLQSLVGKSRVEHISIDLVQCGINLELNVNCESLISRPATTDKLVSG